MRSCSSLPRSATCWRSPASSPSPPAQPTRDGRSFRRRAAARLIGEKLVPRVRDPAQRSLRSSLRRASLEPGPAPGQPHHLDRQGRAAATSTTTASGPSRADTRRLRVPCNAILDGSSSSLDDLIGATKRGLLVTRFWYIRPAESAHCPVHRPDARRPVSDRGRQGHPAGGELPFQRKPSAAVAEYAPARSAGSLPGRRGLRHHRAADASQGLSFRERLGCGLTGSRFFCSRVPADERLREPAADLRADGGPAAAECGSGEHPQYLSADERSRRIAPFRPRYPVRGRRRTPGGGPASVPP